MDSHVSYSCSRKRIYRVNVNRFRLVKVYLCYANRLGVGSTFNTVDGVTTGILTGEVGSLPGLGCT